MQASDIPAKFQIPFANSAGGAFKRTVPVPSQIGSDPSAASFTDGFPPATFDPVAAGGTGPFGQDVNGLLNAMSAWNRWQQAGGPIRFDGTFAALWGGYPAGAILQSTTPGVQWLSTADNNTTDPDGGSPADWLLLGPVGPAGGALSGEYPNPDFAATALVQLGFGGAQVIANPYHYELPGGLIEKGGRINQVIINPDGASIPIAFAAPFPNAIFSIQATPIVPTAGVGGNDVWNAGIADDSVSLAGCTAVINGSGSSGLNRVNGLYWIAKGK